MPVTPPVLGNDVRQWGRQINLFLTRYIGRLFYKTSDDNASEDGAILFDQEKKCVVVSLDNAFRQVATRQATPSSNTGSSGDVAGMVAWDTSYIYICTGTYNGSSAIWKRVALSTW